MSLKTSDRKRTDGYKIELGAAIQRRLRERRLELGLSITALARAAGVGRATLLYAEGPTATGGGFTLATVAAIADVLGVRRAWLAFGEGHRDP